MAKFRQGDLVLTSTQKIIQDDKTILDADGIADFKSLQLSSGQSITEISTDVDLTSDSDAIIPTQKAIKSYVETHGGGGGGGSVLPGSDTAIAIYDGTANVSASLVTIDESGNITIPAPPLTDFQVANKKYVDDNAGGGTAWYYGDGSPSQGTGDFNDYYIDFVTKDLYVKDYWETENISSQGSISSGAGGAPLTNLSYLVDGNIATVISGGTFGSSYGELDNIVVFDFNAIGQPVVEQIRMYRAATYTCSNFTFEGSHNNSDWDVLLTETAQNGSGWATFSVTNSTGYRYYRLVCTSAGNRFRLGELELYSGVYVWSNRGDTSNVIPGSDAAIAIYDGTSEVKSSLVTIDSEGHITLPTVPVEDFHVASKKYVDDNTIDATLWLNGGVEPPYATGGVDNYYINDVDKVTYRKEEGIFTTFDSYNPEDKSDPTILSNENLTVTGPSSPNAYYGARAIYGKSSGKYYWEVTVDTYIYSCVIGVGSITSDIRFPGYSIDSYGYLANGQKYNNNSGVGFGSTYGLGDVIGVALDLDNGYIWWSKNGVWQDSGNPSTGLNPAFTGLTGTIYPMVSGYRYTKTTTNFGALSYQYTLPTDFRPISVEATSGWTIVGKISTELLVDSGIPSNDLGIENDKYIDELTKTLYKKDEFVLTNPIVLYDYNCYASHNTENAENALPPGSDMWNIYGPGDYTSWWYDFGEDFKRAIKMIEIIQGWGGYYFNSFYVYASNDFSNWIELADVSLPQDFLLHQIVLNNTIPYRYYKLQSKTFANAGIRSLEFFEGSSVTWRTVTTLGGLDNWQENGTTLRPNVSGYDIGDITNLVGNTYQNDNVYSYFGASQDSWIGYYGTSNEYRILTKAVDTLERIHITNQSTYVSSNIQIQNYGGSGIYIDQRNDAGFIYLRTGATITTALSINGSQVATFTQFPITPSSLPTTDYQVANKKYVDDHTILDGINERVPWWNETDTKFDTTGDTYIIIDQTANSIVTGDDSILVMTITDEGLALETGGRVNEISNEPSTDSTSTLLTAWAIHELNIAGTSGSSGTSGATGTSGSSGSSGTSGNTGLDGTSGSSGSSGASGTSGSSGTSGISGTSGSSGTSGATGPAGEGVNIGTDTAIAVYDGTSNVSASDVLIDSNSNITGVNDLTAKRTFWDSTPNVNQTGSGDITIMTVDSNITGFGAALYVSSDGNLEEADASDSTSVPCIALALETGTGEKEVILRGFVRNDSWNWTDIGKSVFLSTISGGLTQTDPSGSGEQVQIVGIAKSANIIYFIPDLTVIEIA